MKNKFLFWTVISVLVLGLAGWLYVWLRPQTIVLTDGSRLTLLGVTYGKHHSFTTKDKWGRTIRGNPLDTTNNSICLWLEQENKPNSSPQYRFRAYDRANSSCADSSGQYFASGPLWSKTELASILFEAFPRRGRRIYFRAWRWSPRTGMLEQAEREFVIRNPARGDRFPIWFPPPLPNTQSSDDLDVTLTRLERNVDLNNSETEPTKSRDLGNKAVQVVFRIEQNGNAVTNWRPVQIETMDATGNRTVNRVWDTQTENGDNVVNYQWGLWPDEPAWKLRVEMSRSSGFSPGEIWSPSGLSLTPGDINDLWRNDKSMQPIAEATIDGHHIQLFPIIQIAPEKVRQTGDTEAVFRIHISPPPEGTQLTVITITDDRNDPIEFHDWGSGRGDYRFGMKNMGNTRTLNITLALHRSRYVEFTAKPE
jgi:hypothetical protein